MQTHGSRIKVIQVDKPSWHQRLRHERKLRNWSQAYVAESIGSNTKTVSRWEQGRAFPGPYLRQKLVELFGMSSEELGFVSEQEEGGFEPSRYMHRASRQEWGLEVSAKPRLPRRLQSRYRPHLSTSSGARSNMPHLSRALWKVTSDLFFLKEVRTYQRTSRRSFHSLCRAFESGAVS